MQRVPTKQLELRIARGFLDATQCSGLIERIEADRRPSTIADANGDPTYRTSETCDLPAEDPLVGQVTRRIATALGLDAAHAEPLQGQRYAPGQEFKLHTDYFEAGGLEYEQHTARGGQRTWTAMIYLNTPTAGGATRFKLIDKTIPPEAGKLLAWNNRLPDGRPNYATLHQGMKVRAGVKYIVTQWFRERAWE